VAAAFLALSLFLQKGCKVPCTHACPMLGTMFFPTGQGVAGLFWRGMPTGLPLGNQDDSVAA